MFGVVKLTEDVRRLRAEVEGNDLRVHRRIELLTAKVDQQGQTIELLRKQIKQLTTAANCKITSPTEATPGGEVKKLTEEEIASRDSFNRLFGSGMFYADPYATMAKSVVSDLQKGKTSKKTTKKKK